MTTNERTTRKKKQAKPEPPKCDKSHGRAEIVMRPAALVTHVDMAFIAQHMPKFKLKDLVVIAMALGGKVTMPTPGNGREANPLDVRIEWEV
jgi:hypothetical protein